LDGAILDRQPWSVVGEPQVRIPGHKHAQPLNLRPSTPVLLPNNITHDTLKIGSRLARATNGKFAFDALFANTIARIIPDWPAHRP
jgi:hypothetical protein